MKITVGNLYLQTPVALLHYSFSLMNITGTTLGAWGLQELTNALSDTRPTILNPLRSSFP